MFSFSVIYVGSKIFKSFSIWMVDILTWKSCIFDTQSSNSSDFMTISSDSVSCNDEKSLKYCTETGGTCSIFIDGFYVEVAMNAFFGIFWYFWAKKTLTKLQNLPISDWHVLSNHTQSNRQQDEMLPLKENK